MRLAVIGDLHYHVAERSIPEWLDARNGFYLTVLDRFMSEEADYHVSLGDLTNLGTVQELEEICRMVQEGSRSFIHVLGNHDVYSQRRLDVLALTGASRYHAVDSPAAMLVFLDTARELDRENWGGWIDDEQLRWFESCVIASGTKPLLVFAHHPVYNTTLKSDIDKGSIHPDIDIRRILELKQGTGIYFNGHNHIESIVRQGNWTFVQLCACLDQMSFRIVDVEDEQIRISAIDMEDEKLKEQAALMHRHMPYFIHNPDSRGETADRECVIKPTAAE